MLHTKFQAPEPSSSGEEDFEVYFIFEPKTPAAGPFWTPGPPFEQTWYRSTRQCYVPNIKGFRGDVVKSKLLTTDNARRTMDIGQWQ